MQYNRHEAPKEEETDEPYFAVFSVGHPIFSSLVLKG